MAKKVSKKKKPVKKPAAKKSSAGKQKVWHIVRFQERYELAEDIRACKKGPLYFTKDFVGNGNDDESACAYQQMCVLRSKPNRLILRGVFADLKEIAGNKSRTYRGYLLDEHFRAASDMKIGQWLCVQTRTARKILTDLEAVGLIEKINMPDFVLGGDTPSDKGKESTKKKDKKKDNKKRNSGNLRKSPEISGNFRNPLKKKGKDKDKGKDKADSLSAIGKDKDIKKKKKTAKRNAENKVPKTKTKGKNKCIVEEKTTQTPATTPVPNKPKEADGEGQMHSYHASPPRRTSTRFEQACRIYDPQAKEFGAEIFEKLKVPHNPTTRAGRRELGNFAAAWSLAQSSGLSMPILDSLWEKSVKEAELLARKRRRATFTRNPEAVWRSIFNKRLNKAIAAATATKAAI